VQERVEQAGPGAADVIGVGDELPGEQQRNRPEQVPRVQLQQQALDAGLLVRAVRAVDRDDQAPGAPGRQVVDLRHELLAKGVVVLLQADHRPAVADQRGQQVLLRLGGGQAFSHCGIRQQQAEARPGPLHERVGPLRGGVPDVVRRLQQCRQLRCPVDQLRDPGEAIEQAPAQVVGRGQGLGVAHVAAVDQAEVGQRPAVVDVDQSCHRARVPSEMPSDRPLSSIRRAGTSSLAITAS
jgi:hypothetical protein